MNLCRACDEDFGSLDGGTLAGTRPCPEVEEHLAWSPRPLETARVSIGG